MIVIGKLHPCFLTSLTRAIECFRSALESIGLLANTVLDPGIHNVLVANYLAGLDYPLKIVLA